ncbi:MAG: hypothetical protein ACFFDS_06855 [Candidatus Thorarchaeota archaeon]
MKKKLVLTTLLIFSLLLVISSAFTIQNNQKITGVISDGGGINITGGAFKSHVVVGQPVIGEATSANYKICFGVLCTRTFQTQYYINIAGWLKYDNGMLVKNSPVEVTIKYQSSQFKLTNTTDDSGYFFIRFTNLPEHLFLPPPGKILEIEIYVIGEVEAIYKCTYYPSTEECVS